MAKRLLSKNRKEPCREIAADDTDEDLAELSDVPLSDGERAQLRDKLLMLRQQEQAAYALAYEIDDDDGTGLLDWFYGCFDDAEKEVGDIDKSALMFDAAFKALKALRQIEALKEAICKLKSKKAAKRQRKLTALLAQEAA